MKKIIEKKHISYIICFMFLVVNVIPVGSESINDMSSEEPRCYGFIIPLPTGNEISENHDLQFEVMNLINDLIRLNISVYWTFSDLSLQTVNTIDKEESELRFFNKGAFIVPFTGNDYNDSKINVIIFNYNQTNELVNNEILTVETYLIMQDLKIDNLLLHKL